MINKIKYYLQLCRTHTTPLEVVPAVAGAVLASGGANIQQMLIWGFFGFLYHQTGYGMNSVTDWEKGYDKFDKYKQHHPLNKGNLHINEAGLTVAGLLIITIAYGYYFVRDSKIALIIFGIAALSGVLYNAVGKEFPILKIGFISFAHSSVFAVPYLDTTTNITLPFILLWSFVFMWVFFQIAISGEIKDITEDPDNLLIKFGSEVNGDIHRIDVETGESIKDKYLFIPDKLKYFAGFIRIIETILVFAAAFIIDARFIILLLIIFFGMIAQLLSFELVLTGAYNRHQRLKTMSSIELINIFLLVTALYPIIGLYSSILAFGSLLWVVVFNYIEWGTFVAPDV